MQPDGHQFFKDTDGAMLRVVGVHEFGGRRWTTYARIAHGGYGSVVTVHSSGGEPYAMASAEELREFFSARHHEERGREPDWEDHLAVIERSRRSQS